MSESPSCYRMVVRTARKQHSCCECRGQIQPGERYNYHSGVWDGRAESFKVCPECDGLRALMDDGAYEDELTALGCISADISDCDNWRELLGKFVEIKRQRGAPIPQDWLDDLEREIRL